MKRFQPSNYDAQPNAPGRLPNPTECEIKGCHSAQAGPDRQGNMLFKCGKADVFVEDKLGQKRGVCCFHYAQIVDNCGAGRMSALLDIHGNMTLDSVRKHWKMLEEDPFWEARQINPVQKDESPQRKRGMHAMADIAKNLGISLEKP